VLGSISFPGWEIIHHCITSQRTRVCTLWLSQVKLINAMLISEIITGIWILVSIWGTYAGWTGYKAESKVPPPTAGVAQGVGAPQVKKSEMYGRFVR
jgi:hypothetical protein